MPTKTYKALATTTLSTSASSVTFSNIPATYKDLVFVFAGTASGGDGIYFFMNSDTGSNYSFVRMYGTGTATGSTSGTGTSLEFGEIWGGQGNVIAHIMDYSATDKHKTVLGRTNAPANVVMAYASRWASTSAVTSLTVLTSVATFSSGSTFSLYGIES